MYSTTDFFPALLFSASFPGLLFPSPPSSSAAAAAVAAAVVARGDEVKPRTQGWQRRVNGRMQRAPTRTMVQPAAGAYCRQWRVAITHRFNLYQPAAVSSLSLPRYRLRSLVHRYNLDAPRGLYPAATHRPVWLV